ncbi:MAG: hypothetical protein GY816_00315, partial [Cytophagales bacterium]|nr:hypothetical protein [Cytophagales bacterium]
GWNHKFTVDRTAFQCLGGIPNAEVNCLEGKVDLMVFKQFSATGDFYPDNFRDKIDLQGFPTFLFALVHNKVQNSFYYVDHNFEIRNFIKEIELHPRDQDHFFFEHPTLEELRDSRPYVETPTTPKKKDGFYLVDRG